MKNKNAPVKIQLHKTHSLSMFGYHLKDANTERRREALRHAVNYWGATYVIRKLNVLAIYRKHHYITMGKRAAADMKYVQTHCRNTKPKYGTRRLSPQTPRKLRG